MIICVINQKGGVGKTTLATNLAAMAYLSGQKASVIDCDRQGSAFDWFAARKKGSRLDGLPVTCAPKELSAPKLRALASNYEVSVIDCPPRLDDITRSAAIASDLCIIPARPGGYDYWALADTIQVLDSADRGRADNGLAPLRRVYVLNAIVARTGIGTHAREALKELGHVAGTMIHQRSTLTASALWGETPMTVEPNGKACNEMRALYKELTQ